MKTYNARIVGFKWSQKRPEKYRPIFEYKDQYGETRQYIRLKGLEKTPFTMEKTYKICKCKSGTYEQSEKRLSFRFCTMVLKIIALIMMLINLKTALIMDVAIYSAIGVRQVLLLYKKNRNKKLVHSVTPVTGKIIGYQKFRPRNIFSKEKFVYRPLIQYVYDKCIYTHISSIETKTKEYRVNSDCFIYVDEKHQGVYDEIELGLPLINMQPMVDEIKQTIKDVSLGGPTKVYIGPEKEIIKEPKTISLADTRPIHIPLRTAPTKSKVSNWY